MNVIDVIADAHRVIRKGGVIAYPTEAVWGLGCDPFNPLAVEKLLSLKKREASKGFILLISNWDQLAELTRPIPNENLLKVQATWPGPVTWIFPKSEKVPNWLTGSRHTIAIRMSAHPIASALSDIGPIVSTSANLSGQPPFKDIKSLISQFSSEIDAVVNGALGGAEKPSSIYDALTGNQLR